MKKDKYKIAIILFNFYESGLSLAKALTEYGYSVDVYSFSTRLNSNSAGFGFEYEINSHRLPGHIYEIDYKRSKGVSFASEKGLSHVYIMQSSLTGVSKHGILKWMLERISILFLRRMAKQINSKKYDFIEIVSQDMFSRHLYPLLNAPNVHSFHEVSDSDKRNDSNLNPLVDLSIKRGDNIRVYSNKASDTLRRIIGKDYSQLYTIPFGLFVNYRDFGNIEMPELGNMKDYILYVGLIVPYKGLSILYKAMQVFWKSNPNVKCIVAGKGYDVVLDKMKSDSRFVVINRLLSNDEIVYIIKKARFLVCPYLRASQSGLPQTAYVFGKPIIATNVGAFSDVIEDGETGLLVPPNNSNELFRAINKLYNKSILYNHIVENLRNIEKVNCKLNWKNIVCQYSQMIKSITGLIGNVQYQECSNP
jgi:glycosyltransferase involved in cell wall biosynthesis